MVDPLTASSLQGEIDHEVARAAAADAEADRIRARAVTVRDEFDAASQRAQDQLSGTASPGGNALAGPAGISVSSGAAPGVGRGIAPGFGVPISGLDHLTGVIPVHGDQHGNVPGYGAYDDTRTVAEEGTDPGLLDPTLLIGGGAGAFGRGAAKGLRVAGGALASGGQAAARTAVPAARTAIAKAGRALSLVGNREAANAAATRAARATLTHQRHQPFVNQLKRARRQWRETYAEEFAERQDIGADNAKRIVDGLGDAGVPMPSGAGEVVEHVVRTHEMYRVHAAVALAKVEATGSPNAARVAKTLREVIEVRGG